MQQRDRSFHDPAVHAQAGAVPGAAPGEVRGDLEPADLVPVDLVVIAAVGVQIPGAAQWLAVLAADRRDGLDHRDQLGDVVAVAAGGDCRERNAVRLDHQVVIAAGLAPGPPGTDRWPAGPSSRGCGWSRPLRGRSPAGLRPAARTAAARAGAAIPRPRSSPAAVASRSSPSRSPTPGAETPGGSRCRARTGSRTAPCDYPDAYDLDAADYAGRPAAAARSAPTTRRRSPTVWQRSSSSRLARPPSASINEN